MKSEITVEEAIKKGKVLIHFSIPTIVIGTMFISMFCAVSLGIRYLWVSFVGIVLLMPCFIWLYWSFAIIKWKLWAFGNVRNVHELKERATIERLMGKNAFFMERTEIWSRNKKEKWNALQSKFKIEDVFSDDLDIPYESVIHYSKFRIYSSLALYASCLIGTIYLIWLTGDYIVESVIALFFLYLTLKTIKQVLEISPKIIMNDDGIKTSSTSFFEWKDIRNASIDLINGKYPTYLLVYDHPDGSVKLVINNFKIDRGTLHKLLTVYQGRNKKNRRY